MPFKWQKVSIGSGGSAWTNTGQRWAVVVGVDANTLTLADAQQINVMDQAGDVIDNNIVRLTTVTAIGEEFLWVTLPRRMLIPPGGKLTSSGSGKASIVIADFDDVSKDSNTSLEKACLIL